MVAFLVPEHGLWGGTWASVVVDHAWASLLISMWDLLDLGLNPCPLHWQVDSQALDHQGNPELFFYTKENFF